MKIDYILNDNERIILGEFFLVENSQGKTYRAWLDNFLAQYELKIEKEQDKYSEDYQLNLMWDKDTHLLQYILKQDKALVPERFRYILKLNSSLDRTDENGNNLLHLSSEKQNHHWLLNFFLEHHNYDIYQTNGDGHTYHTLFVKNFDNNLFSKIPKQESPDFINLIQDTHYLFYIVMQFSNKFIKDYISKNIFDKFVLNCDTILDNLYSFQKHVNSPGSGLVKDSYLEETQNFEKTLNYIKLSNNLKPKKANKLLKI